MQDVQQYNNLLKYQQFDSAENESNKRKKATRACLHCQKAHLTCDDSRPCQRCVKRGLAPTCTDAVRKKAKYLQDTSVDNQSSEQSTSDQSDPTLFPTSFPNGTDPAAVPEQTQANMGANLLDANQFFNFSLNELQDLGFGSETAGLEYGFLGNMLQNPLDLSTSLGGDTANNYTTTSSLDMNAFPFPATNTTSAPTYAAAAAAAAAAAQNPSLFPMFSSVAFAPGANPLANHPSKSTASPTQSNSENEKSPSTVNITPAPVGSLSSPSSSATSPSALKRNSTQANAKRKSHTPEAVYMSVRKPFNYAEGFHYLIQYVREKMGREDLMRISRALALFRPSFLALIMNLTEEDLVFMEKCIQRTLLEYEKLISFSGTPTVVWRRTGEVCLVGKEFLLLTQWSKDTLLNKKTYIYELMDNQSAVEYWEKFSMHAFDNTDKSCIYSCILKTPHQKPVPCTFCFTIKRDIFDLPSVIVGNFLPILS